MAVGTFWTLSCCCLKTEITGLVQNRFVSSKTVVIAVKSAQKPRIVLNCFNRNNESNRHPSWINGRIDNSVIARGSNEVDLG